MMDVLFGNAGKDSRANRGWLLGHFINSSGGLRHCEDIEIKWGVHAPGEARTEWSRNQATTITILIRGRFKMVFQKSEYILEKEGDYVIWAADILHKWVVEDHTLIITVRWPSYSSPDTAEVLGVMDS